MIFQKPPVFVKNFILFNVEVSFTVNFEDMFISPWTSNLNWGFSVPIPILPPSCIYKTLLPSSLKLITGCEPNCSTIKAGPVPSLDIKTCSDV